MWLFKTVANLTGDTHITNIIMGEFHSSFSSLDRLIS